MQGLQPLPQKRSILTALALLLALSFGRPANAACVLDQPPNMTLGPYSGTQVDTGSTNLTINCTTGSANYTIGISGGSSGVTTARTMKSGTIVLNYSLSRDAARTQNWGNVAGTDTYAGSGATASVSVPIYPRIAGGQLVAPGTYTDTVSTASKSFTVTATILPSCSISTSPMGFGVYSGAVLDATSAITLTCSNTTSYTVSLNQGLATSATTSSRQMTRSSASTLNYTLSSDAARTANWGNNAGVDTVAGTGSGSAQTLTVYGRVPASQRVTPGSYADTIIATITY